MEKNVLVIGSGGREHAICWKLSQSGHVKQIYNAPGSFAISQLPRTKSVPLDAKKSQAVVEFCQSHQIDLVVVGPEDYLANGIADELHKAKIHCFGPRKLEAQIETDKAWAKTFMDKHGIPQPRWGSFTDAVAAKKFIRTADFPALVVKANGLAAGKGVIVAKTVTEACEAVDQILGDKKFGKAGETVVIEECLEGEEISVLAFTDGKTITAMLPVQDHKRIGDGDTGPNTGGMGVYCPCPPTIQNQSQFIQENILNRTLSGLLHDKLEYNGVIFAGLMLTRRGIRVLEFNCRMGDPETQVVLPLLESDLFEIMMSCCQGTLAQQKIVWKTDTYAVGVIMASHGYPEFATKGEVITGIENVEKLPNHLVFHSGTAKSEKDGSLVTNGGRVLISVAFASDLSKAAYNATFACSLIHFSGAQYRHDIAFKGIVRQILQSGQVTYKTSGVDIVSGDNLVQNIKPLAAMTNRIGCMGGIGGFAGLFDMKLLKYKDPILVAGTDGVGTKLKIANACSNHKTIGIDLVAMCVNDLLAQGAEPLFFLDYYATGKLSVPVAKDVIAGIAEGCKIAGCALIGGETAEMPGMYSNEDYDLAGFAVGVVEREHLIPRFDQLNVGDVAIGLPSSGIHSNGFSLVRYASRMVGINFSDPAPFSSSGKSYGEEFLVPTKIYIKSILPLVQKGYVKAFSHITGGGLLENLPRILRADIKLELQLKSEDILPVFGWLAAVGGVNQFEMLRTFNCGIGGVLIVAPEHVDQVLNSITEYKASVIGKVIKRTSTEHQVTVPHFDDALSSQMRKHVPQILAKYKVPRKRVGVLISGSGTNLQALIDATNDPTQHIGAEIVLVISNKSDVEGLRRASRAHIPTKIVRHTDYTSRESFDQAMHNLLVDAGVEVVCLAGFMRILSSQFVTAWRGKIVNIHPSLLPSFKGVNAQKQALDAGVKVTGCTVHFVEPDLDSGPIIMQETVPIYPDDTEATLVERIKTDAEHKVYPQALKMLATNKIFLDSNGKIVHKN